MIRKGNKRFVVLLAIALACAPIGASPGVLPTADIGLVVAQTASAALAQTATLQSPTPTFTSSPIPTKTATVAFSPTVTFIFFIPTLTPIPSATPILPTFTPITGKDFSCVILSKTPTDNTEFEKDASFTAVWTVQNNGKNVWDSGNVDFFYAGGASLHANKPAYDLETSVPLGGKTSFSVKMIAPHKKGSYTTTWKIRSGKTEFCPMSVSIVVK